MQRRLRLRGLALTTVLASAAALTTVAAAVPAVAAGPAAHYVVLGPQGSGLARTEASVRAAGGTVVQSWSQIGVVVATSPSIVFAQALRRLPAVQGVGASRALVEFVPPAPAAARVDTVEQFDSVFDSRKAFAPTAFEPLAPSQWDMRLIRADAANGVSTGSRDVLVGVLDSGIEATHPDLAANIDAANSVGCTNQGVPDTSPAAWAPNIPHGTHVAGIIAAARNGIGIAGVAPGVRLASVKVVDDGGFIYPEYAICGFIWAGEHRMQVTNNSYFIDPWFKWCRDDPDQRAASEAVRRAINFAARRDVVNVVAMGNDNWDLSHDVTDAGSPDNQPNPITRVVGNDCPMMPQEIAGVIGVSSVGPTGQKAYYSSYGISDVEVAAPGGDRFKVAETPDGNGRVLSTVVGGRWDYAQGTSMASPHAAGVVALIRSTHRSWSADRVARELERQADRLSCPANPYNPNGDGTFLATCQGGASGRGFYGAGLIDALDAVTK